MRIAYFDCLSGISGDMTLGALVDAGVPLALLNEAVRSVLDEVHLESEQVVRKGFRATKVHVRTHDDHGHGTHHHHHEHRHLSTILKMVEAGALSDDNKRHIGNIFHMIAEAEALVHGTDIEKIHFHEVGAADSIADIVGAVVGLDYLDLDTIQASPVPTGTGTIEIAHGTCSVPAPATAELLRGIPIAASSVPFELTTPTGAAILKYYVREFGPMPLMTIRTIGVGAGDRDLATQPNILRLLVGDIETGKYRLQAAAKLEHDHTFDHLPLEKATRNENANDPYSIPVARERAWMLETNLDDVSGEIVGHCVERLWSLSPLDVWTTPIQMKKQRPGVTLSVLCREEQCSDVEAFLFTETSTLGIRRWEVERSVLRREPCQLQTPWGLLEAKRAFLPDGTQRVAPEFEAVKRLAAEKGVAVRTILESFSQSAEP